MNPPPQKKKFFGTKSQIKFWGTHPPTPTGHCLKNIWSLAVNTRGFWQGADLLKGDSDWVWFTKRGFWRVWFTKRGFWLGSLWLTIRDSNRVLPDHAWDSERNIWRFSDTVNMVLNMIQIYALDRRFGVPWMGWVGILIVKIVLWKSPGMLPTPQTPQWHVHILMLKTYFVGYLLMFYPSFKI